MKTRIKRLASRLISDPATRRVARTLYHGTTVDNEASIRKIGLVGGIGGFTEWAYGEYQEAGEELEDLVFAADKRGLGKAINAMTHHVGAKLGKNFHDVTDNDILNHGLLVIIYDTEDSVEQRPEDDENYYGQYPLHVEPGDYYSESLGADKFVKGRQLVRFLNSYGLWPVQSSGGESGQPIDPVWVKKMRGWLIGLAYQNYPEKSKQEIMDWIQGLSDKDVMKYYRKYKGR
jgi:hypothetical protein